MDRCPFQRFLDSLRKLSRYPGGTSQYLVPQISFRKKISSLPKRWTFVKRTNLFHFKVLERPQNYWAEPISEGHWLWRFVRVSGVFGLIVPSTACAYVCLSMYVAGHMRTALCPPRFIFNAFTARISIRKCFASIIWSCSVQPSAYEFQEGAVDRFSLFYYAAFVRFKLSLRCTRGICRSWRKRVCFLSLNYFSNEW